jgi:hypothetical protein
MTCIWSFVWHKIQFHLQRCSSFKQNESIKKWAMMGGKWGDESNDKRWKFPTKEINYSNGFPYILMQSFWRWHYLLQCKKNHESQIKNLNRIVRQEIQEWIIFPLRIFSSNFIKIVSIKFYFLFLDIIRV